MIRTSHTRNPIHLLGDLSEEIFKKKSSSEILMSSIPPQENQSIQQIHTIFRGKVPLKIQQISSWPEKMPNLCCLHCGGFCDVGPPLPAVERYESQLGLYWVYGPFCRSGCALGYISEHKNSKAMAYTISAHRDHFGIHDVRVSPPRNTHQRFGGPLYDHDFHGTSGFACTQVLEPPFVTFANYVVANSDANTNIKAMLPQSAGNLIDIQRPTQREFGLVEKKATGHAPLFLEYLASLSSVQEIQDVSETIELKKRKTRASSPVARESKGFLSRFLEKQ